MLRTLGITGGAAMLAGLAWLGTPLRAEAQGPQVVTLDVPSPLIEVRMMVKAGSAHDPAGLEGLAALTAQALLEAGFGDPADPVTKEDLARITRPWGSGARPRVFVEKESSTLIFTVPKDVLGAYLEQVLGPMLSQPQFTGSEIERIRDEAITAVGSTLRYENIEMVGLEALDNYIFDGTPHGHTVRGSVQGLGSIDRADVQRFFATYYRPDRIVLGISTTDADVIAALRGAVARIGADAAAVEPLPRSTVLEAPEMPSGRELTIVGMPDAIAAGVHAGFPLEVTRTHQDYWPLYVANIYFGTHRDSHSHLYKEIRQKRGYNYGDYSYIEHFYGRPFNLFRPFNTPRSFQYFAIWIRPVGAEFAHHITKAASWELENLLREGVSRTDFELSKNKARVLYLNLAENSSRLLAARVDDAFYGMEPGYLEGYLENLGAVTHEQVNAALRRHLQAENVKFLIVTNAESAQTLADHIRAGENASGKEPADYQIDFDDERGVYLVPPEKLDILRKDEVWRQHPLRLDRIDVVPVEALFETGAFAARTTALR